MYKKQVSLILVLIVCLLLLTGHRFTPEQAASLQIETEHVQFMNHFKIDDTFLYVFKNEKTKSYVTVTSEKTNLLYRSRTVSKISAHKKDLQMISTYTHYDQPFTFFVVQSFDNNIGYIQAGKKGEQQIKSTQNRDMIPFFFSGSANIASLQPVALNHEKEVIYRYDAASKWYKP
ncbi:hypothetical protein J416_02284 [Gracilibacillus halophilus YIM-C55.5]|uniref:Uncharacterized protein n=1 Tax=Gracilibacillus halophilus YIM-C55.5 TaxID=1308866 RepID=N4WFK0_9BACI|nr:hypothetical protein [Gracilibacillus halophilus]ENH98034.1 hypothetical protein J416_02284 [Gracilibacillus halophilus YIM-C55.5]